MTDESVTINPASFEMPKGILFEDAVIIDDQDDHLVLTLRVPKDVIWKNRPLLSALVEMSAPTWSPAEPEDDLANA